jgi:stage V sporulation protein R
MRNFKDESFIAQYLSPKLMRDLKLFRVVDDDRDSQLLVSAIHDEGGYRQLRAALSEQYNLGAREPNIQVYRVNKSGDRSLTLRHAQHERRPLSDSVQEIMKHLARLWGFTVRLETVSEDGKATLVAECKKED